MFNFNDVNEEKGLLRSDRALGKFLRLPLRIIPKKAVLPILQGPGSGLKWIAGSYTHGCWLGSYEFEKQQVLPSLVKPGDVVYDIGAHVGYFTIICAKLVGPTGQVVAFEPFPENHEYVLRHVALNHLTNVVPVQAAVGAKNGTMSFEAGWHSATGRTSSGGSGTLRFKVVELIEFMRTNAVRAPNLIKMDIEGAEEEVIPSIIDFMVENKVKLLMSTHSDAITGKLATLLASRGYRVEPLQWSNLPAERRLDNATLLCATI